MTCVPLAAVANDNARSLSLAEFTTIVDSGLPETALVRAGVLDADAAVEEAETLAPLGVSFERQEVFADAEGVALQNSVTLEWSFDVSGRRGQRIDAAASSAHAARLRGERSQRLAKLNARAMYWAAARARLRLASLERSREPLANLTASLKRRASEGDVAGADVARFELALSDHDDRVDLARAELEIAEKRLAALLGRPGRIAATDDLSLPSAPEDADSAVSDRADLRAADEDAASGRALMRAADRWWIPTVDVSAGFLSTDFGPGTGAGSDVASGYLARLSFSVPLFSRGNAERKRGEARAARARATRELLERRVRAELEAATVRLASRIARARAHESRRLKLTAALVAKTESAFAGGEATALELRDAYAQAVAAGLRTVELRYEARLAELDLLRARGNEPPRARGAVQ